MVNNKFITVLFGLFCIVTLVIDIFFLDRSSNFAESGVKSFDGSGGMLAAFAFISSILLIYLSRLFAKLIQVDKEYYNDDF